MVSYGNSRGKLKAHCGDVSDQQLFYSATAVGACSYRICKLGA